jgi:hypothetical protein
VGTRHRGAGAALILAALPCLFAAAARAETPAQACARAGTEDATHPIPAALVPAAQRLFGITAPAEAVERLTLYRCMEGKVMLCTLGANLPCGKANRARSLPGASQFCRQTPGADVIPAFATGHDTIYRWRCQGSEAVAGEPVEALDARGFIARYWKPLD